MKRLLWFRALPPGQRYDMILFSTRMRLFLAVWLLVGVGGAECVLATSLSTGEGLAFVNTLIASRDMVKVGDKAPNFRLQDLAGNVVSLSELRGKVVLLNFWATWCGPCRVEMPSMEQLYRTLPRGEFEILAVSTDPQGVTVTRPFQQEIGLTFPILHDPDMRIGLTYGARSLPMTVMVDRRGIVRQKIFGAHDWDSPEARDLIRQLMKL
jgi:peroxiredoxin